jgi:O-antigen ligase
MASDRPAPARRVAVATRAASASPTALDHAQRWALIAVVAWAPLPFGSARPWAWTVLGLVVPLLLLGAALREYLRPSAGASMSQLRLPLVLGALLVGWMLVQVAPQVPAGWHHPLWDKAIETLGDPAAPAISIDRDASLDGLFRLLTYAGVFFLAWQVGQRSDAARLVFRAVLAIGTVYALYGLVEYASPTPRILWFRKWTYGDDLTSTFVNRNSFATFAGLALVVGLVPITEIFARNTDARSRMTLVISALENLLSRAKWAVAACLLLGSALLLSHSRAGSFATACGIIAFIGLATTAPSLRSDWRKPFAWIAGAGAALALVLAGAGLAQRVEGNSLEADSRPEIFLSTLGAVHDNALTGTGLGTFRFVFPMYQSPELDGIVDLAHNDYLENLLELGVPAALLLFAVVGLLAIECLHGVRRRRKHVVYPCAGAAASVLVAVHSCVDFSLQIPAVTVLYVTILGIGVAQSVSSRRAETSS